MLSLAHGVPMVCAGTGEGKNDVNAHVEYHRAGINLRTEDPTAAAIQAAVERVTNRATVARPSAGVRRRDARPGRCAAGRGSRHRTRAGLLTSAGAPPMPSSPPRPSRFGGTSLNERRHKACLTNTDSWEVVACPPAGSPPSCAIRSGGRSPLRLPDVRTVGGARGAAPVPYTTMQYMQRAITHLIAGVPVSELGAAVDWYTRFFGRPPDARAGEEALWDINEHATLFIEPNAVGAGTGRITFAVAGLDALLERLAAQGITHEPIETYPNGVRHAKVPDPDGNAIAFAEPPAS